MPRLPAKSCLVLIINISLYHGDKLRQVIEKYIYKIRVELFPMLFFKIFCHTAAFEFHPDDLFRSADGSGNVYGSGRRLASTPPADYFDQAV